MTDTHTAIYNSLIRAYEAGAAGRGIDEKTLRAEAVAYADRQEVIYIPYREIAQQAVEEYRANS